MCVGVIKVCNRSILDRTGKRSTTVIPSRETQQHHWSAGWDGMGWDGMGERIYIRHDLPQKYSNKIPGFTLG
jgi:hypothetical protein